MTISARYRPIDDPIGCFLTTSLSCMKTIAVLDTT
ncbi:MAG: hypothetical protein ACJAZW_003072 [Maritalea sp.]|jgi:hypothetical protein